MAEFHRTHDVIIRITPQNAPPGEECVGTYLGFDLLRTRSKDGKTGSPWTAVRRGGRRKIAAIDRQDLLEVIEDLVPQDERPAAGPDGWQRVGDYRGWDLTFNPSTRNYRAVSHEGGWVSVKFHHEAARLLDEIDSTLARRAARDEAAKKTAREPLSAEAVREAVQKVAETRPKHTDSLFEMFMQARENRELAALRKDFPAWSIKQLPGGSWLAKGEGGSVACGTLGELRVSLEHRIRAETARTDGCAELKALHEEFPGWKFAFRPGVIIPWRAELPGVPLEARVASTARLLRAGLRIKTLGRNVPLTNAYRGEHLGWSVYRLRKREWAAVKNGRALGAPSREGLNRKIEALEKFTRLGAEAGARARCAQAKVAFMEKLAELADRPNFRVGPLRVDNNGQGPVTSLEVKLHGETFDDHLVSLLHDLRKAEASG